MINFLGSSQEETEYLGRVTGESDGVPGIRPTSLTEVKPLDVLTFRYQAKGPGRKGGNVYDEVPLIILTNMKTDKRNNILIYGMNTH